MARRPRSSLPVGGLPKKRTWASTVVLSVCLAVLVGLLAALQWRWLDEIEDHEFYRRDRQVGYYTWLFKMMFDHEIASLARAVTAPAGSRSETAPALALRLDRWRASTRWPQLLGAVYLVETGRGPAGLSLRQFVPEPPALVAVDWPPPLAPHAPTLAGSIAGRPSAVPAEFAVVPSVPALLVPASESAGRSALLLVLDREFLAGRMLPEIVRLLFPPPSFESIDVAVVETQTRRVLYSTLPIETSAEFGRADVVFSLVPEGAGPGRLPGPLAENPVFPSRHWQPTADDVELFRALWSRLFYAGHWQILVRRGEVPIVEEVAALRRRGLTAAFGLLGLLSASVALLTVVSRRTERAAREQLALLARVSHELRTPLSVLASAGDNLADGVATGEEKVREYGLVIRKETRRLKELVENVLHLARRRTAAPGAVKQVVDLVEVVEDSYGLAAPSLEEARFTVERALPPQAVRILGEPRALRSAVLNLISNAIKYGRSGRWLRLAVERDHGAEARIVVEDRGPGMAEREVPRLFEPYARGERAMADETEGSGLGLAVVRDVVEAHAGRITVVRPAGGGAAFILHFPLADAP